MRIDPAAQIRRLLKAREAATAIEYALIAAGIAGVLVATISTLGDKVLALWNSVLGAFT